MMFLHLKTLCCGKSEHTVSTIEDAYAVRPERGLFALADGVGTRLSSRLWAQMLVQHAISVPLLSADPFELEWWLTPVQTRFATCCPTASTLPWEVAKKAKEGSASTLCTLTLRSIRRTTVHANIAAIGDSCLFIGNEQTQTVRSFPYLTAFEFEKAPICLPSLPRKFHRTCHCMRECHVQLGEGETVILATDAVARWLLTHTEKAARWQAFEGICGMTERTWDAFITGLRVGNCMEDDDATVIIVRIDERSGIQFGTTSCHEPDVIAERHRLFAAAVKEGDKERMALLYGDGQDLQRMKLPISKGEMDDARAVSGALDEVRHIYFNTFGRPDAAAQIERAWQQHEVLFHKQENRKNVQTLLSMLQENSFLEQMVLPEETAGRQVLPPSFDWWTWLCENIASLLRERS